jgi:hypothetical protein
MVRVEEESDDRRHYARPISSQQLHAQADRRTWHLQGSEQLGPAHPEKRPAANNLRRYPGPLQAEQLHHFPSVSRNMV